LLAAASLLVAGIWAMSAVASARTPVNGRAEPRRDFESSNDPGTTVLEVRIIEGMTGKTFKNRLMGDHRLVFSEDVGGRSIERVRQLSESDAKDLVGFAVDAGLLDVNQADLDQEIAEEVARGPLVPPPSDAGTVVVEVRVERYFVDGVETGSVERTFTVHAIHSRARRFPGARHLAALNDLYQRVWKLDPKFESTARPGE